ITTLIGRRCTHSNVFSRPVLIGRGLGACSCSLWNAQGCPAAAPVGAERTVSGGHGGGETPVPIPNTAVKPASADGTWGEAPWESRTPPGFSSAGWLAALVAGHPARPGRGWRGARGRSLSWPGGAPRRGGGGPSGPSPGDERPPGRGPATREGRATGGRG